MYNNLIVLLLAFYMKILKICMHCTELHNYSKRRFKISIMIIYNHSYQPVSPFNKIQLITFPLCLSTPNISFSLDISKEIKSTWLSSQQAICQGILNTSGCVNNWISSLSNWAVVLFFLSIVYIFVYDRWTRMNHIWTKLKNRSSFKLKANRYRWPLNW